MSNSKTIIIPDNDLDRTRLYKKGFKNGNGSTKNYLIVPDKYICKYTEKINPEGGCCGGASSLQTWIVYTKKNKPVISISQFRDGDYPPPDKIIWF